MAEWSSSWSHGNAVRIEEPAPKNEFVTWLNYGWGFQAKIRPGYDFWFHIPLTTPVDRGTDCLLNEFYLLWSMENFGSLNYVHVYDGGTFLTDPNEGYKYSADGHLGYSGDHLDYEHRTVFHPRKPEVVQSGLGISFNVSATVYAEGRFIDFDTPAILTVGGAGARYVLRKKSPPLTEKHVRESELKGDGQLLSDVDLKK